MLPFLYGLITSRRDAGAFGVLLDGDGKEFAVFLMPTFENNRIIIGPGEYDCIKTNYIKGGYPTFEIIIKGHTRVLFHIGNIKENSTACVLVAESFDPINGKDGISQSGRGFKEFWDKYKQFDKFTFKVSEFKGEREIKWKK